MAEPALEHLLAGDEFFDLGDIGPCELIDGRIVPIPPTGGEHGTIEGNIAFILQGFVRPRALGWVVIPVTHGFSVAEHALRAPWLRYRFSP